MITYFPDSFFNTLSVYKRKLSRKVFGFISLKPKVPNNEKLALISFVTHPFAITKKELLKSPHTTPWECLEMAHILLERGYSVDIIDWTNPSFTPSKKYKLIIDVHQNLERFSSYLPSDCIKIYYITGAHWSYHNKAELDRLAELKNRRGVTLMPRRQISLSKNIEYADYVTSLGNDFAKSTYSFSRKEITQIPLMSLATFPSPEHKNFKMINKNFVWIGGGGAVHKGLDVVLECFAKLPDFTLTICGPVAGEADFYSFYKKELCEMPNIHFVGRIDVRGEQFRKIVDNAVGLVYPSVSEGQAGSVIVGLHAGLIPITIHSSGVDIETFGLSLSLISIDEIEETVKKLSSIGEVELRRHSIAAWQYARNNHSQEIFYKSYSAFIDKVLQEKNI